MGNEQISADVPRPQKQDKRPPKISAVKNTGTSALYPPITHIKDSYIQEESGQIGGQTVDLVDPSDMALLPHRHIGAIVCKGPAQTCQTGTGLLISKNLVLTCAHVVTNRAYNALYPHIQFFPGQYGDLKNPIKVEDVEFPEEYTKRKEGYKSYDYALMKLNTDVDEKDFIPLHPDASKDDSDRTLSIFGYPESKYAKAKGVLKKVDQFGLTRQDYILEVLEEAGYIVHRMSTEKGQSGAPVIKTDKKGKTTVVGLHVGCSEAEEYCKPYQEEFPDLQKVNLTKILSTPIIRRLRRFADKLKGDMFQECSLGSETNKKKGGSLENSPAKPQNKNQVGQAGYRYVGSMVFC